MGFPCVEREGFNMHVIAWMTIDKVDHWEVFPTEAEATAKAFKLEAADNVYCWIQSFSYNGSEPHYIDGEV